MSSSLTEQAGVEQDLDQTRARLDGTLGELRTRMTPGQVVDDLMRYFRGQEGAEFGRNLLDGVRSNPLPAAVTGIGLTWLMATNTRAVPVQPGAPDSARTTRQWQGFNEGGHKAVAARINVAELGVVRTHDEPEHRYTARLDDARGQALGLARHAQESEHSFGQRVRDALASVQESATGTGHDLRDRAGGLASTVAGQVQGAGQSAGQAISHGAQQASGAMAQGGDALGAAGSRLMTVLSETPMLLGALGLAAGALLGTLLPQSQQEEAALHDAAGQAREAARDLAQEAVDEGKSIGSAVADKGMASADAQKLTGSRSAGEIVDAALSGKLAVDAKQVVTDVLQASDEAVRKVGLGEKPAEGPAA